MGFWATSVHILVKLDQENLLRMVRWMRWHCTTDTWFDIRALAVCGRACYLSVTESPHNIETLRVSGEETFRFFETWRECQSGVRTRDHRLSKQAALTTAPGPRHLWSDNRYLVCFKTLFKNRSTLRLEKNSELSEFGLEMLLILVHVVKTSTSK